MGNSYAAVLKLLNTELDALSSCIRKEQTNKKWEGRKNVWKKCDLKYCSARNTV